MWARRATELEAKINSGDILQLAEVIRDLHRGEGQAEASFSEGRLYEAAVALMANEVAASRNVTETEAMRLIREALAKAPQPTAKGSDEGDEGGGMEKVA
jgi:CarD family transcriptional regulator